MTTPAGVPNLPIGALTVETLGQRLQDQSAAAMRNRAGEQMPSIFGLSTGGNIASDLSPFGILTNIWAGINSLIANSDPNDIQGPEDLPPLFMDFIENLPVIGQFVQLLEALTGNYTGDDTTLLAIQDFLEPIRLLVNTIGQEIADWLNWLVGTLFNGSTDPLTNIFTTLAGLLDDAGELTTWLNSLLTDTWKTLLTTLQTLFGGFDLETFLQPLFTTLKTIWDLFAAAATGIGKTAGTLIADLFGFLSWLWNGVAGGFAGFSGTVNTVLKPLIEFLNWLWALFSTTAIGSMETLKSIFTELSKVLNANGALTTWIDNIPLIGPLVKYLTANIPNIDFTPDLAGLGQWANQLLHRDSSLPAGNLIGEIPQAMLSMIPVANINISSANLLGQGSFATAGTVEAANGWEWDSTTNDPTGQSSGSAKLTTDGTARYLYARQAIKVAAGDKITLSARIKTASYTGTGTSIVLSVIPYAGTTAQTEKLFASRGASNGAWATMTGSATDVDPYIVPAGVTSLIVKIGVTSGSGSGSTLWVDNVDLRKEGLLGQNLVEYLLNAWEDMWHGLVGTSGSGKTWADMFNAANFLRAFANGTQLDLGTLSGNLLSAPAEVIGSIFGVKLDANNKTVADFLKLLYNALNKSTDTTPKSADDVATAAAGLRDDTNQAVKDASDALDAADAASQAANTASGGVTNLHNSLLTGYTVVTVNSTTTWTKPANLSELYVVLMGAGANGSTGSYAVNGDTAHISGGAGGTQGRFVATQIDLALVSALSTVAVTVGTPASPTTSFGSIVNSAAAFANYVATPLGLMSSASLPGDGGTGGEHYAGAAYDGTAGETTATGVAGGTGGAARSTTLSGNYSGYSGNAGGSGALYASLSQSGGSGGGGGGAIHRGAGQTGIITGGSGGNGGFPGGGGGGGGAAVTGGSTGAVGGPGGSGANGMALIVYKIAKTTA